MDRDALETALLVAHECHDEEALVRLYTIAGDEAEAPVMAGQHLEQLARFPIGPRMENIGSLQIDPDKAVQSHRRSGKRHL